MTADNVAVVVVVVVVGNRIQQIDLQSCLWSAEQGKMHFPCPRSRLRIWSRETGSAVPSRVSPLILHAQAKSGAYTRAPLFPPASRHGVVSTPEKRHRVSLS